MAPELEALPDTARAEARSLGLEALPDGPAEPAGFAPFFARLEANYRAVAVAECRAIFDRYRETDSGDLGRFRELYAAYCFPEPVEGLLAAPPAGLDASLSRRVELYLGHLRQFKVAGDPAVAGVQEALETRFFSFQAEIASQALSFPQLSRLLKTAPERKERQRAWEALLPLGEANREAIRVLARRRNVLAREMGYRDFVDFKLRQSELSEDWFRTLLAGIEAETRAPYDAARAEIARVLGVESPMPWDVPYGIEQISPLPPETFSHAAAQARVEKLLVGWGFSPPEIAIPTYDCERFPMGGMCFGIEPGREVAILMSPVDGPRYHRTYFHEYGHAMHFRHAGQGNILLNVEDQCFNEGMAVFFESFVADPAWVSENLPELDDESARRFCRQARHATATLVRANLINIHFELALYQDPDQDLDACYLALQRRLGGFELPASAGARWAADQMIVSHPVYWYSYVIAELIAHQLREAILEKDGALLGNPGIREFLLTHCYRPGSSLPWQEKIARATGKALDGGAFSRYLHAR